MSERFVQLALEAQHRTVVVVRFREIRLEMQGLSIARQGLVQSAEFLLGGAEIVMGIGVSGEATHGLRIALDDLVPLFLFRQHKAAVVERRG